MSKRWHKIWAKVVLAYLFNVHLIQRILFFWKKPGGVKQFFDHYAADGIFPVSEKERRLMPSYQRCQACSLCTFSCEPIQQGNAPPDFEPKFIILGFGRSSHESEIFLDDWLPCLKCDHCTIMCPNQVPIHAMAAQIIERRKRIGFRQ